MSSDDQNEQKVADLAAQSVEDQSKYVVDTDKQGAIRREGAWLDNESRAEQLLEAREAGENAAARRVTWSMVVVKELFGENADALLPLKFIVDCPGESLSEVVILKKKSLTQSLMFVHAPLLSKIKAFSHHHRKWRRGEDCQRGDEILPTVILELGMKKEGSRSMYMGVFLNQGRWQSQIRANKKLVFLGHFKTEIEAARVYDSAMTFKKGDKAKLNFPDEQPQPLADKLKERMMVKDVKKPKTKRGEGEEGGEEDASDDEMELGDENKDKKDAGDGREVMKSDSNITCRISMAIIRSLFGADVQLPMKILVDHAGDERKVGWLGKRGSAFAALFVCEPIHSKIQACHPVHRKWSVSEAGGSDSIPLMLADLAAPNDCKFIGVSKDKDRWMAKVTRQGRQFFLGTFPTQEIAAQHFDSATYFLKGDKAKLNFPHLVPEPPSDEIRAKLLSSPSDLSRPRSVKRKRRNKQSREVSDEEEMMDKEEEEGEGEEEESQEEEEEEEAQAEEDDPYYARVKSSRRRTTEISQDLTRSQLLTNQAHPAGQQTHDEEYALSAAEALMSMFQ